MPYRFVTNKLDYSDYASGRVFFGTPGHPAFPVRLASEIFQTCLEHWKKNSENTSCVLYDPVCGGAYHLSVLAYLHWDSINTIICSDIDPDVLNTARRNLSLLTLEGINKRSEQLQELSATYGKHSHLSALESAARLRTRLVHNIADHSVYTRVGLADAMDSDAVSRIMGERSTDIVIADVPYGNRMTWKLQIPEIADPITHMLTNLLHILSVNAVVAIVTGKGSKPNHPEYKRIDRFQVGKRRVVLLSPVTDT